jgi:hypothetical protein
MSQSHSKKRIVKPPLDRFGGVRVVQRRIQKSQIIEHNKESVAKELVDIGKTNIADIMDWDEKGNVTIKDSKNISEAALKSIKKIKVTPTKLGPQIDVELHDKVAVLRVLAKAAGLLEQQEDMDRPSVVGIVMQGPEPKPVIDIEEDDGKSKV